MVTEVLAGHPAHGRGLSRHRPVQPRHARCLRDLYPGHRRLRSGDLAAASGSRFLRALNAGQETYAGIDYTVVYTATVDEVVVPNVPPGASSELHTGPGRISNIVVQEVCPGHLADHLSIGTTDTVAYATVIDAISHDGPAKLGRIDRSSCVKPFMPGVNPITLPYEEARLDSHVGRVLLTYPHVPHEARLKSYARDRRP